MSQFFYCTRAYNTIDKFLNKMFKSFVDSFGSWCIIASVKLVIRWPQWWDVPVTLVRSSSDFQIFNDFENLQKASKLQLKITWLIKMVTLLYLKSCIWKCAFSGKKHKKKGCVIPVSKEATPYPYSCSKNIYYKHCPRCRFMYGYQWIPSPFWVLLFDFTALCVIKT